MLIKHPKPASRKWLKKGAVALFVFEGACFAGSYFLWHRANTDRDFRKHLKDNYPFLLEYYYKAGELLNSQSNTRQVDQSYWGQE
ncbi:unnamed protein product [Acanthoscelides obtectus]|uniref:Uncharacterized protein n=1 Tax=Acanthoscelides obtectus TaxID=200917 RepID=A0A9P0PWN7_ACAOB|nr:unnamed protein product [Acanthoscelides obtectus]CAK1645135.1 Protein CEBPZOS [Acanthoscelides obtectus]